MSPTTLGQLPSNQPAPTGLVQVKRGAVSSTITWNNTVPAQPLQDGAGAPMTISITPPRRGWWLVHAVSMWLQIDPGMWQAYEVGVDLSVADLNGWSRHKLQNAQHAAIGWVSVHVDAPFYLEAGNTYSASSMWLYSSGYNQQYHTEPGYHYIEGEFIGDGAY